jgi:two-component system, NarL family, nitrate/nitrite response regulator NarL
VPSTPAVRILIVDDHEMFRQGLKMLLRSDPRFEVVGEASSAQQALALAAQLQPEVILLDVDLEGTDGLDIAESLQASAPGTRIIVLTGMRGPEVQARALRLGAKGFVAKEQSGELVMRAILGVRDGELWFDRGTGRQSGDEAAEESRAAHTGAASHAT